MVAKVTQKQSSALEEEMERARRASGISSSSAGAERGGSPDPEVAARAARRQFSAKYKLEILEKADRCENGELVALLRREGLYTSNLTTWRRQREAGSLAGLTPRKRGRKPNAQPARDPRIDRLERDNAQLRARLKQAETIIEVQKKVSDLLGMVSNTTPSMGGS